MESESKVAGPKRVRPSDEENSVDIEKTGSTELGVNPVMNNGERIEPEAKKIKITNNDIPTETTSLESEVKQAEPCSNGGSIKNISDKDEIKLEEPEVKTSTEEAKTETEEGEAKTSSEEPEAKAETETKTLIEEPEEVKTSVEEAEAKTSTEQPEAKAVTEEPEVKTSTEEPEATK